MICRPFIWLHVLFDSWVFHCSTLSSYTNFSLVNLFFMRPVNLFARTLQLVGYTKLLGQYSSTNYQLPLLQIKSSTLVCIIIVELLMIKYCLNVWWSACFARWTLSFQLLPPSWNIRHSNILWESKFFKFDQIFKENHKNLWNQTNIL